MTLAFRTRKPLTTLFTARELAGDRLGAPAPGAEVYTDYVFPIAGQGTISLNIKAEGPFRIILDDERAPAGDRAVIVLEVGTTETRFRNRNDDAPESVIASTTAKNALVVPGVAWNYWFSLDAINRVLSFGKGEMLPALCVFRAELPPAPKVGPDQYAYLSTLRYIGISGHPMPDPLGHFMWPVPVTVGLPGRVVPADQLTLDDIAANRATVVSNLDAAAQVLYGNVAGAGITLDTPDFPDFSEAINHSINTPGLWCYTKLAQKATEFGGDNPDETYLRITIGPNQGDSPGSPYVLEIWPGGHYSPIHNHGQASAIIKVLHGQIWVELYPELNPAVLDYYVEATFQKGDVTFLSPQFYQVHKLVNHNPPGNMTATIQCYRYPSSDTRHYEYFDYIGGNDAIEHFTPNSDAEFAAFKNLIRREWLNR